MSIEVGKQDTFQNLFKIIKPEIESKQDKRLSSPIVVNGASETTVEGAINGLDNRLKKSTTPVIETRGWIEKDWGDWAPYSRRDIWTDGNNIYHSNGLEEYDKVLDKTTGTWKHKNWNLTVMGEKVWSDGINTYYENNYVLNKTTQQWESKTWTGMDFSVDSRGFWSDGIYIYYSWGECQKRLKISTSTWNDVTWSSMTNFYGIDVWTDGDNIYCSNYADNIQKKFNKPSGRDSSYDKGSWDNVTWTGINLDGSRIWTDGDNIYYSYYVLDKETNTWISSNIPGNINAQDIWTDGKYIYYSAQNNQGIFQKKKMLSIKTI